MTQGLLIDGVAASTALDSSGEILDIEGCDISEFINGTAPLNWEHKSGSTSNPSDIIGKVVFAKKIFDIKDCTDERQLMYWKKLDLPYIYVICRLYDAAGHPEAIAAAAQIRDHVANNEPINIRFSIEGATLEKDGPFLKKSLAKALAATMKPCNKSCDSGLLMDPQAPEGFKKDFMNKDVIKSEIHPFIGSGEVEYIPFEASITTEDIKKALSAGGGDAAPSSKVDGSALQREDLGNKVHSLLSKWDKKKPLKEFLKTEMPEISDDFIKTVEEAAKHFTVPMTKTEDRELFIRKMENWTIEFSRLTKLLGVSDTSGNVDK